MPRQAPTARPHGFTLIELMITLAIVAVLAGMAIQSYSHYTDRARRAEGRAALLRTLLQQEQQFSLRQRYQAFSSAVPSPAFMAFSGETPARSAYRLHAAACQKSSLRQCVRVTATPNNWDDQRCGALWIESGGQRGATRSGDCW